MSEQQTSKTGFKSFPMNYWVVIFMEFFERGSYYGMMSILSVYMTDQLDYTKESVGVIKSVIQPMLYILPILSGAIGDRFGYKRVLTFAFIFLGLGYFLTSQCIQTNDFGNDCKVNERRQQHTRFWNFLLVDKSGCVFIPVNSCSIY